MHAELPTATRREEPLPPLPPRLREPNAGQLVSPKDRPPIDDNALLSAAVALDVLATCAQDLIASRAILENWLDVLLRLSELSERDPAHIHAMCMHMETAGGAEREVLTKLLAGVVGQPIGSARSTRLLASPSSPELVAQAIARVVAMADIVVSHASVAFEAQQRTAYRRI